MGQYLTNICYFIHNIAKQREESPTQTVNFLVALSLRLIQLKEELNIGTRIKTQSQRQ
jgi:hypothetical protein